MLNNWKYTEGSISQPATEAAAEEQPVKTEENPEATPPETAPQEAAPEAAEQPEQ